MGLFDKLKRALKETAQVLKTDIRDPIKAEGRLVDDAFINELLEMLTKMDVDAKAAEKVVEDVQSALRGRLVQMEDVAEMIEDKLKSLQG